MGNKSYSKRYRHIVSTQSGLVSNPTKATYNYDYTTTFVRTGSNLPKYKQVIATSANATNALSVQSFDMTVTPGGVGQTTWSDQFRRPCLDKTNLPRNVEVVASFTVPTSTVASDGASTAILKKVKATQSQMMGGVFLKEFGQTVHLIRHPAESLVDLFNDHLSKVDQRTRHKSGKRVNVKRALADTWLETQFAMLPLLADVRDGAVALARLHDKPRINTVSCVVNHEVQVSAAAQSEAFIGNTFGLTDRKESYQYRTSYHCGVKAETDFDDTPVKRVMELTQLTLSDFVPTVWECLPWSFLVDYFSNVGDVLTSASVDQSRIIWVSRTDVASHCIEVHQKIDVPRTTSALTSLGATGISVLPCSGSYKSTAKTLTRTSSTSIPLPALTFELPASPFKWANIAALLVSGQRIEKTLRAGST